MTSADQLEAALRATLTATDAGLRQSAEQQLSQWSAQSGLLPALAHLVANGNVDLGVRQAAAVYLKNRVSKAWDVDTKLDQIPPIPEDDRSALRQSILLAIHAVYTQPILKQQLLTTLNEMLKVDYPSYWAEFPQLVHDMLHNADPMVVASGLFAVRELLKVFRFRSEERKHSITPVIDHLFPRILEIISTSAINDAVNGQEGAAEVVMVAFKSYFAAIQHTMPQSLLEQSSVQAWTNIFLQSIRGNDPTVQSEARDRTFFWKMRKWAMHCLNRMFVRYGNPAVLGGESKKYLPFAEAYISSITPAVLEAYLSIVFRCADKQEFVSPRCRCLISNYLTDVIKHKVSWKLLKPHHEAIVQRWIFPELSWTPDMAETWAHDQVEFVHAYSDLLDEYRSPKSAAVQLLVTLVEDRKKVTFLPTLQFINQNLLNYNAMPIDQRDSARKYGLLTMVSCISIFMASPKSPVKNQMEEFIHVHVVSELDSPLGFMRAKACDLVADFAELEFANQSALVSILHRILKALNDPDLPVRVSAGLAIFPLVHHETLREAIVPHLADIMRCLLVLTQEIDLDTLGNAMEGLVEIFADDLAPFAVQLSEQLRDTILSILHDSVPSAVAASEQDLDSMDFNEYTDKVMAAQSVLRTLQTLVDSLDEQAQPDVIPRIEQTLAPMHQFILEHAVVDLFEEDFEIISQCIFAQRAVSKSAWEVFVSIMQAFQLRGDDFVDALVPCLDNYVSFGHTELVSQPELLQHIIHVIDAIMDMKNDSVSEMDRTYGCRLIEALLLNCRGGIDQYLDRFIVVSGSYLMNSEIMAKFVKTDVLRLNLIEIVSIVCVYFKLMILVD